jgi:hypothetical protein
MGWTAEDIAALSNVRKEQAKQEDLDFTMHGRQGGEGMIEIYHVSDLHFGRDDELAKSLLNKVNPLAKANNNYLLVTGDITNHGKSKEYDLAGEALKPIAGRIFLTPGNHDYGGATVYSDGSAKYFDDPFAKKLEFKHSFFDKRVYRCEFKASGRTLVILGLNSCIESSSQHWGRGEIGARQMNELKDILTKEYNAKIPKILFLHHIPNRDADAEHFMTLMDWEELMSVVKGKVDVLAFGHQGRDLEVGSAKSLVHEEMTRPMAVHSFYGGQKGAEKRTWVLDANASVAEQACYKIKWDGEEAVIEPEILNFGVPPAPVWPPS